MIDYHLNCVRGSFKITGKIVSDGSDVKWDLKNVVIGGNQIPRKKPLQRFDCLSDLWSVRIFQNFFAQKSKYKSET